MKTKKPVVYKVGQRVKSLRGTVRVITKVTDGFISFRVKTGKLDFAGRNSVRVFRNWHTRRD